MVSACKMALAGVVHRLAALLHDIEMLRAEVRLQGGRRCSQ